MRFATRSFQSAVRAWPSSSIVRQITAAPYSRASLNTRSMRLPSPSPSSRLAELRIALPPWCCRPGFDDRRLGRVEHERQRRLRREPARDLVHVDRAVAADVVDAHVEHVRAFLHLLARHLHAGVPVGFEHRVAELPRAVGVGALADREVRELLVERHVRVDRRATGLELGRAHDRRARVAEAARRPGASARASCRSNRRRC